MWRQKCSVEGHSVTYSPYSHFKQGEQRLKELNCHQGATFVNGDSINKMSCWPRTVSEATRGVSGHYINVFWIPGKEWLNYSSSHWSKCWNKDLSGSIRGSSLLICLLQRRAEEQGWPILPEPSDPRDAKEKRERYGHVVASLRWLLTYDPCTTEKKSQMTARLSPIRQVTPLHKGRGK